MSIFIGAKRVAEAPPAPPVPTDYDSMEKADLFALCEERGLSAPKRATKAQLIALLEGEV